MLQLGSQTSFCTGGWLATETKVEHIIILCRWHHSDSQDSNIIQGEKWGGHRWEIALSHTLAGRCSLTFYSFTNLLDTHLSELYTVAP